MSTLCIFWISILADLVTEGLLHGCFLQFLLISKDWIERSPCYYLWHVQRFTEFSEDFLAVNFLKLSFKIMAHNCATRSLDLLLCIVIRRINMRGQRDDNGDKNHNIFFFFVIWWYFLRNWIFSAFSLLVLLGFQRSIDKCRLYHLGYHFSPPCFDQISSALVIVSNNWRKVFVLS